jgi:Ribosomal protein S4 and related proteins
MARYTGASCRQCRREGTKLFLKGSRCLTEKCAVERRGYAPGQHGQSGGRSRKASEYAKQLREKQKVKRMYGLTERQFRNTFDRVTREAGVKGTNLLIALESRLDNIVYRMGFSAQPEGRPPAGAPRPCGSERPQGGRAVVRRAAGRGNPGRSGQPG